MLKVIIEFFDNFNCIYTESVIGVNDQSLIVNIFKCIKESVLKIKLFILKDLKNENLNLWELKKYIHCNISKLFRYIDKYNNINNFRIPL